MSGLFGKTPKAEDPARMPVMGDAASKAAEERKRREIASRGGRASTNLTKGSGGSGTDAYKASLLGSAA